jgi:predicted PurR-regulated permease PerM
MPGDDSLRAPFSRSQVTPSTVVVVVFTLLAIAGGLFLLWQLSEILRWLVIALFLAVALDPAVSWVTRRGVPRAPAILLVYLLLLLVIGGLSALVLPPLVDEVEGLGSYIVGLTQAPGGLDQFVEELANRYGLGGYVEMLREQARALPSQLTGAVRPLLAVTRGIIGSLTALVSILLLTFFLLLDSERFLAAALALRPAQQRPHLHRVLSQLADAIHAYVNGNLLISLIAGTAAFVALTILRVPYAVALALVVALLDLIPLVGSTLGAALAVLVALFVDPVRAAILAVYFLVYQQIENNILQPLVHGRSIKLHPLGIFVAVLAGGELLGILGAVMAIPVAEIIRILAVEWLATRAQETGGRPHSPDDDAPLEQVTADATGPVP